MKMQLDDEASACTSSNGFQFPLPSLGHPHAAAANLN